MKTLDDFNADRLSRLAQRRNEAERPHPNGILCPKCGAELWDTAPMVVLTSNPPQKNVHCGICEYRGYRFA